MASIYKTYYQRGNSKKAEIFFEYLNSMVNLFIENFEDESRLYYFNHPDRKEISKLLKIENQI